MLSKHNTCLLFSVMLACLLASGWLHAAEKLRIGWVYAMANAPVVVAQERGFFREQGVAVELRRFNSGPLIIRALKAGDLDMAYIGVPPVYNAIEQGLDIKIVSKVNYGQAALIVKQDSAIKTLEGLRGKKIASVRRGSGMDILLRGFVLNQKAGLNPDTDVKIVSMPAKMMEASVHRGVVDAAFTWEPYVAMAELTEHARVLLDMNEVVPRYPWYVLIASAETCNHRRGAMLKVLRANRQAIDYLNKQPEASNHILIRAFDLRDIVASAGSKASVEGIVKRARTRLGWESRFSKSDRVFLQQLMDYSYQLGYSKRQLDISKLFDPVVDQ